jgi:hypothetical protein
MGKSTKELAMPRDNIRHHLARIPIHPDIAYDLTYHYPPKYDADLIRKHVPIMLHGDSKIKSIAESLLKSFEKDILLTPKQRVVLLMKEFPHDLRLKAIRTCMAQKDRKWERSFRLDPKAAYEAEAAAISRAVSARNGDDLDLEKLEAVLAPGKLPIDRSA